MHLSDQSFIRVVTKWANIRSKLLNLYTDSPPPNETPQQLIKRLKTAYLIHAIPYHIEFWAKQYQVEGWLVYRDATAYEVKRKPLFQNNQ